MVIVKENGLFEPKRQFAFKKGMYLSLQSYTRSEIVGHIRHSSLGRATGLGEGKLISIPLETSVVFNIVLTTSEATLMLSCIVPCPLLEQMSMS